MENNPAAASVLGRFFSGVSSSVLEGLGRSTMICFFVDLDGGAAGWGFGAGGGELTSFSLSLPSESE